MTAVAVKYIPWLRQGASTLINTPDDLAGAAASFQTQAEVQFTGGVVRNPINLFGPADVVGLGNGQVTRREPTPGSTGFEPNYFPSVEFRDADLPWRFTPTRAVGPDRLRPWLTLIAVEQSGDNGVRSLPGAPLPAIGAPVKQLPNPAELDRWAHVQVAGPFPAPSMDPAALENYVRLNPSRAVARLLCPRRLQANTSYVVCLVPTFEVGRRAGLGETFDPDALKLQFAWTFDESSAQTVQLPVYDSWTVSTGPARDPRDEFERLARALQPYRIPADAATRPFQVGSPLTTTGPVTMRLPGALRPMNTSASSAVPTDIKTNLAAWVNQSVHVEDNGGEPEVTPPLYARWQSGHRKVNEPGTPVWLNELNLDPRMRAIAAIGGDLVQRHQDEFVAEAWRQAGEIKEANQLLRGAQTARSVNHALTRKHFEKLPAGMLLHVAGPDRARIRHGTGTLQQTVSASGVPDSGVESTFRRVARVRGPHTRAWNVGGPDEQTEFLFRQGFVEAPTTAWTPIDEGTANRPSNWVRNATTGEITQTSNIHTPFDNYAQLGTTFITGDSAWRDFTMELLFGTTSGGVGVVFRHDAFNGYYRFSMDSLTGRRRLFKVMVDTSSIIWQDSFNYTPGTLYPLRVEAEGTNIRIFFSQQKIVDFNDPESLPAGKVGLYAHKSPGAKFSGVKVRVQAGLQRAELLERSVDEGNLNRPSLWTTDNGNIKQIHDTGSDKLDRNELPKLGAYLKLVPDSQIPSWTDYSIRVTLHPGDDDAMGVMFRWRDAGNFYRFSFDQERSYQRLVKCVNGQYQLLWQRDEGFWLNNEYALDIVADGTRLRGYLGNEKLFDLRDRSHANGTVAFYSWANTAARFKNAEIKRIRRHGIMARLNAGQLGVPVPANGQLNLNALRTALLNSLSPTRLVNDRAADRLRLPQSLGPTDDPLNSLSRSPDIPIPLSTRLIEHAPHLMLPGIESVPENAVVPLETNPAFVAALMAGANHEMTRELLWRGPNTDVRATVFRQFWDVRGTAVEAPQGDIQPVHLWAAANGLNSQLASQSEPGSVFLIRSELLRRFPDARLYLVEAVSNGSGGRKPGSNVSLPLFRGRFADDIAFFGFAETSDAVLGKNGGLGWYFVIEQRPDSARFGLLIKGPDQIPDWSELGWNHVSGASYARATPLSTTSPSGPQWGHNAAHIAAITQRRPFRLLMHATRLLISES